MLAYLFRCEAKLALYQESYQWRRLFNILTDHRGPSGMKWYSMIADTKKLKGLSDALDMLPSKGSRK